MGGFAMQRTQKLTKKQREAIRAQIKPLSVALVDQAKNFYLAVGQGISHWSNMEGRLVQVAAKLVGAPEAKVGLIMFSVINIHTWIQIIDDLFLIDGTYPNSMKLWRSIARSLKAENDIRVRLAHHSISQERFETPEEAGYQAYLRPARLDTRAKSKKFEPLTMVEIVNFTGRVGDIHEKLISLLTLMKKRKPSR
jgi:hypothetical protein